MVAFGQKWLYSGKVIVFGQGCFIRGKWLHLGKVVVFGQSASINANWFIGQKGLYSG